MRQIDLLAVERTGDEVADDERLARVFICALDAEVGSLDTGTKRRLVRARYRALTLHRTRPFLNRPAWFRMEWSGSVAAGCAVSAVIALTMSTFSPTHLSPTKTEPPGIHEASAVVHEMPVLTADEDLEFYGSIDFLLWLEQQRV